MGVFIAAWTAVTLATVILVGALDHLPSSVPVFQTFMGTPTMWAPKSIPMVTRIALMGAGQLGAVTALARHVSWSGPSGWTRLLKGMALAVGAKTLVESIGFAGTATTWGETVGSVLNIVTILIVVAFLAFVVAIWRSGALTQLPRGGTRGAWGTIGLIGLSLGLWVTFATIPWWY